MRKVIYTSVVGMYDEIRQPEVVDPAFDYICFTDDLPAGKRGVWEIRPIPCPEKDPTRRSRYVKLLPHRALADYDASVWIDANIRIKSQAFYDAVDSAISRGELVAQVPHLTRDCVYEEIPRCYRDLRIGFKDAYRQRRHLIKEGFPRHFGLMENNVIVRMHNDPLVKRISEGWWNEYSSFSPRDQLSLMPVYWKEGFRPSLLFGEGINSRNAGCIESERHSLLDKSKEIKGFRRIALKFRWTFRRIVASLFLR